MGLVRDYLTFATRFAGIGYVAMWPLASTADGTPFGGAYVCRALTALCEIERPFTLPHSLHVLGAIAAIAVTAMIMLRITRRLLRRRSPVVVPNARVSAAVGCSVRQSTLQVPRSIKPRKEFGLRRRHVA